MDRLDKTPGKLFVGDMANLLAIRKRLPEGRQMEGHAWLTGDAAPVHSGGANWAADVACSVRFHFYAHCSYFLKFLTFLRSTFNSLRNIYAGGNISAYQCWILYTFVRKSK